MGKMVTDPLYHIWSDALHGRSLARQARNRWDCGTYVRWTLTSAWTMLEMVCSDLLSVQRLGRGSKSGLTTQWGQLVCKSWIGDLACGRRLLSCSVVACRSCM